MALGYGRVCSNQFSTHKYIVDLNGIQNGATHVTVAAAIASASAGESIFIKPGTYVENITTKAGVRLCSDTTANQGPSAIIQGTVTMTEGGVHSITGIQITSASAVCIDITGSNQVQAEMSNCRINMTNGDGLAINNATGGIDFYNCRFDQTGNTLDYFNLTSCSFVKFFSCDFQSSAGTKGTSTIAAGEVQLRHCDIQGHQFTTSAAGIIEFWHCYSDQTGNLVFLTTAGTGTSTIYGSYIESGSSVAVSIGSGTTLNLRDTTINSTNATPVGGAGTINYSAIKMSNSGSGVGPTTETAYYTQLGKYRAQKQPAFSAYLGTTDANETGDGTEYTLGDTDVGTALTEEYDQDSNFTPGASGGAVFTAPVTGIYAFNFTILLQQMAAGHTPSMVIKRAGGSAKNYTLGNNGITDIVGNYGMSFSHEIPLTAADTVKFALTVGSSTKVVDVFGDSSPRTFVSGHLIG